MDMDRTRLRHLREALLSAFPTYRDLEMMVFDQLNEQLSSITREDTLEHRVFELIQWAIAKGRLEELVIGALKQNSHNPQLSNVTELLGLMDTNTPRGFDRDKTTLDIAPSSSATSVHSSKPLQLMQKMTSGIRTRSKSQRSTENLSSPSIQPQYPDVDKEEAVQPSYIYKLAKGWMQLLSLIAVTLFLGIVSTAVGLNTWGPTPITERVTQYRTALIIIGGLVLGITSLAWFVSQKAVPKEYVGALNEPLIVKRERGVLIAAFISTTSAITCFTLISVVMLHPAWCPTLLCPASIPIYPPHSVHDEMLEVHLQTIQSATHVLPDDPATYTPNTLPTTINALRVDTSPQNPPYRVIVGIHNLQQGRYLIIEQVTLLVTQASLTAPYPLQVWTENELRDYHSNLYQALYKGQEAGASLPASYVLHDGRTGGHVQLAPGESDELDIQVMSHIVADLHFQVQVTYRVINESQERKITLPDSFEIIFSDAKNWFPYHLQDGHLTT